MLPCTHYFLLSLSTHVSGVHTYSFFLYPADKSQPGLDLVRSLMVSGSVIAMTDSISETALERIGVKSSSELLLLESVKELKTLLSIAMHKKL
jgi:hypothetical protein